MWIAVILLLKAQFFSGDAETDNYQIVGGDEIEITEAPYQVSLWYENRFDCGGSIIAKDVVLTAAHCLYGKQPSGWRVRVGSSYKSQGGVVLSVKSTLSHPRYKFHDGFDYDIGIMWLSTPLRFSKKVAAIPMKNSNEEVPEGAMIQVTGFGDTQPQFRKIEDDDQLRRILVPTINFEACKAVYKPREHVSSRMLCAGTSEGGIDSCKGDSGGPLVHDGKLAGIVSFGKGCARKKYPGVYTKVSALRKWIDEEVRKKKLHKEWEKDFE